MTDCSQLTERGCALLPGSVDGNADISLEVLLDQFLEPLSIDGQRWEALVSQSEASGFMQSLYWARLKQAQGMRVTQLILRNCGDIIGGALLYTAPRNNGAGILSAPDGPVLPWADAALSGAGLRLIMEAAESLASKLGTMSLRIEPRLPLPVPRLLREFGRSLTDQNPQETLFVSLAGQVEDILSAMRHKGRYNIGQAAKRGVQVLEEPAGSSESVRRFYGLLSEAAVRNGFLVEPCEFFEDLVEAFSAGALPCGLSGSPSTDSGSSTWLDVGKAPAISPQIRFFFAELDGDTIGALLMVVYGRRATYLYGGVSGRKREAMCGYALQWAAMQSARALGCVEYDMYGYDQFRSPDNEYARFSQFKEQFGGEVKRFIGAQEHYFVEDLAGAVIKAIKQANLT
ncbi:MAG: peptidoglycan bridge formation glycyltransferase FemA/FemB family protein [Candidatus Obscuribacter sp.]|nr:peptidoglycan bridge formation glycyltransferase FemA/FemB family protein [Candidatus Obscuribacter sp.]